MRPAQDLSPREIANPLRAGDPATRSDAGTAMLAAIGDTNRRRPAIGRPAAIGDTGCVQIATAHGIGLGGAGAEEAEAEQSQREDCAFRGHHHVSRNRRISRICGKVYRIAGSYISALALRPTG
jgi:hypothetical protein